MQVSRILIGLALVVVLGVPFVMRPAAEADPGGEREKLIVITPHVQQIRAEFEKAFDRWHREKYGTSVSIDWRTPGGTSEILKQLQAVYSSQLASYVEQARVREPDLLLGPKVRLDRFFVPGSVGFDVMFGGGSFDHSRLGDPSGAMVWYSPFPGAGVEQATLGPLPAGADLQRLKSAKFVDLDGEVRGRSMRLHIPRGAFADGVQSLDALAGGGSASIRLDLSRVQRDAHVVMSEPAGFDEARLVEWYGDNRIGNQKLYDPEQYWLGTALSSFGIVYSRDVLARLGLPEPRRFDDLTDPRYLGWIALADPRQSGSVTTTFEAILNSYGWDRGWRMLREMCANTRYFTNSSTKPPIDVSAGEAAAGLAIDFYGRSQAQSILRPGERPEDSRVGYVDPAGAVYIDADPVSILRGGPNPGLARRFVEFCLSEEAQALWQFPADRAGAEGPMGPGGRRLGPDTYELRRMPVRRVMYEKYLDCCFTDKVNPFELAREMPSRGWRSAIGVMMGSFAIDIADEQRAAWAALNRARRDPAFPPEKLIEMERLFYAWPRHEMADGTKLDFSESNFGAIEKDTNRWRDPSKTARARMAYTEFFRRSYARVVEMAE